jgi:hypothetical protein
MRNQVSAHALSNLLGVSEKAIIQLAKSGVIAPAPKGRYYLQASVHSYAPFSERLLTVGEKRRDKTAICPPREALAHRPKEAVSDWSLGRMV